MIELLLALVHCFSKVVFGMETKIGEIKMRATAARQGSVVCILGDVNYMILDHSLFQKGLIFANLVYQLVL